MPSIDKVVNFLQENVPREAEIEKCWLARHRSFSQQRPA
jgi:hypothetical protein